MSLRPLPRFAITKLLLRPAMEDGDKDLFVVAERVVVSQRGLGQGLTNLQAARFRSQLARDV